MKKSKLFLTGILGILLVFGLVLTGCPTDGGDSGVTNPPETPDTVDSKEAAKEYFYDVWGTLSDEQKAKFIALIKENLPADRDIGNLDDLEDSDWEDIKDGWSEIKDTLQEFVDEVKEQNDTTSGGSVPETNAQVYWRDGKEYTGNGTVKLMYWGEDNSNGESIGTVGTVTNGKLTLSLPASILVTYLVNGEDWIDQMPGLTITPSDVQFSTFVGFDIFFNENSQIGFYFMKETSDTYYEVSYMYFSKAAKISGSISNTSEDGVTQTQSINIDAKAGWNKVYTSGLQSGNTRTSTVTTDLSKVPSGLKWTIPATGSSSGDNGGNNGNGNNNGNNNSSDGIPSELVAAWYTDINKNGIVDFDEDRLAIYEFKSDGKLLYDDRDYGTFSVSGDKITRITAGQAAPASITFVIDGKKLTLSGSEASGFYAGTYLKK